MGPGVNDALNAIPLPECAGMTKEQLEKRRDQDIEAFRKKCLDFYVTGAKEMKNYLPINNRILKEAEFINPKVALLGAARSRLPDLKDIAANFKVITNNSLIFYSSFPAASHPFGSRERMSSVNTPQFYYSLFFLIRFR